MKSTEIIFFSPTHTSAKIARAIASGINSDEQTEIDLTTDESTELIFISDALVIIAVPVYGGRVAPIAKQRLQRLRGVRSAAILVCVYGNRDYEDALVELRDEAVKLGFCTLAAGAFIGEHSFSSRETPIAAGRPDAEDLEKARKFGEECLKKLSGTEIVELGKMRFFVKGSVPYRALSPSAPVAPQCNERCVRCGECVSVCPTHAISVCGGEIVTDAAKCIRCCACVKDCGNGGRVFDTPFAGRLSEMCAARREPEIFM